MHSFVQALSSFAECRLRSLRFSERFFDLGGNSARMIPLGDGCIAALMLVGSVSRQTE